ncbi:hypothetical protein [Vibrio taketomensis]|uniref:hypothetical protein n=1 Tax=Vibrio taketomensis TaxID=2572923 RepID=UPI0013895B3A|nr:hypothetical protein [Vibrio taketomensis]
MWLMRCAATMVLSVPLNINGSVAIVLTSDAIIDEHSSGVRLTSDVAENKQSVVVHAYGTDVEGTAEFNIETARGRMHTIRLVLEIIQLQHIKWLLKAKINRR